MQPVDHEPAQARHTGNAAGPPARLVDRRPQVPPERLLAELVPPPRFERERFSTYVPDPAQPSQARALRRLEEFAGAVRDPAAGARWWRFGGRDRRTRENPEGVYLDGGFGVGKTHLLAALWHATEARRPSARSSATRTWSARSASAAPSTGSRASGWCCIDEFELDDPGDTVLMSRLLRELVDADVKLAATSNTLPDALGEGRFAADDFRREIQGLAARFEVVRIEGEDYRHRGLPAAPPPLPDAAVEAAVARPAGSDPRRLRRPARRTSRRCIRAGTAPCWTASRPWGCAACHGLTDQAVALRLVVFADRLYDRDIPLLAGGEPLDRLFSAEMLAGGYRKKYRRAASRLVALAREGARLARAGEA